MIVKLSGDKWINTERICSISKETRGKGYDGTDAGASIIYSVQFDSSRIVLSQTQGQELLYAIKEEHNVFDAEMWRKRGTAERTLVGQMGYERFHALDDDAQYDAITDEVARQEAMQSTSNHKENA